MSDRDKDLHLEIFQVFDDETDDEDFVRIRNACTGYIRPAKLQKIKNMRELNTELQKQGTIGVGNYSAIYKILDKLKLHDLKTKVEEVVKTMDSVSENSDEENYKPSSKRAKFDRGSSTQTDVTDLTYSKVKKGLVFIINIMDFGNHAEYRTGSDKDMKNVEDLFNSENGFRGWYTVLKSINCTLRQLEDELAQCQEKLRTGEFDQFICFIFSHGEEKGILTNDGQRIMPEKIINRFKGNVIPEMAGHPKIFIFQACRGGKAQPGHRVDQAGDAKLSDEEFIELDSMEHVVPVDADIVAAFSTTKGFVSIRNMFLGSWYIRNICKVFSGFKQEHLLDLLTRVHYQVSVLTATMQDGRVIKQMPSFESTLTKKMYLHHSQQ